ncbi:hypothetical protein IWQ61_000107 [Dispira simplex]|nr:hypothetical protein IWQ61_000107 [Dispira simplex]
MARSRRSSVSSSARRPAAPAAPARRPPPPQTAVAPPPTQTAVAHPPASQGPGLFGQMASTAAGVAVGSAVGHTIGHAVTGMFGGGSSTPAEQPPAPAQQPMQAQPSYYPQTPYGGAPQDPAGSDACAMDAKSFAKCLTDNSNDLNACQWQLDMLKYCQANSSM